MLILTQVHHTHSSRHLHQNHHHHHHHHHHPNRVSVLFDDGGWLVSRESLGPDLPNSAWTYAAGWWQINIFYFHPWGNDPIWLIFFRWVETTNQADISVTVHLTSLKGWVAKGETFSSPFQNLSPLVEVNWIVWWCIGIFVGGTGGTFSLISQNDTKFVCCFDARSQPEFTQMKMIRPLHPMPKAQKKVRKSASCCCCFQVLGCEFLGATTWMFFK